MLQRIDLRGHDGDLADVLPRPAPPSGGPVEVVHEILAAVEARGDAAVREFTERFDGVALDALVVPAEELTSAVEQIAPEVRAALQLAADRVAAYHAAQVPADVIVEQPGMSIRGMHRAVQRAACYVPGGRAVYPSTVVMTVVPARVAGVEEIVVCVPPGPDGQVPDVVLAAASIAGAHEVVAVGGAQAIGAVAFGTESIRAVDVIVGPGNVFVALAKQAVAGRVGVPSSFAGPSEVVVIADGTDPIDFAAIDVILQAEHGPDGLAWFITWDADVADAVTAALSDLEAPGMVLRFVHNADFAGGQAGSVATGVSALSNDVSGALIALGDMPFVSADLVAEMIQDHSGLGDHEMRISFPVYEGRRGNPVLWGRGFFEALAGLSGDIGGRRILAENPAAVNSISWTDDSIHNDIDTGDDLQRHLRG